VKFICVRENNVTAVYILCLDITVIEHLTFSKVSVHCPGGSNTNSSICDTNGGIIIVRVSKNITMKYYAYEFKK